MLINISPRCQPSRDLDISSINSHSHQHLRDLDIGLISTNIINTAIVSATVLNTKNLNISLVKVIPLDFPLVK